LLGTNKIQFTEEKAVRIRHLIPTTISADKAAILENEVTAEEIRDILFHMPANNAPGPDGFSADFFKASWSIVGEDMVAAIKGFFCLWFVTQRGQCYHSYFGSKEGKSICYGGL
jgi:hypothetical protein